MIVITTPTGNIGRHLTQQLLSSNEKITLLVRDAQKLPETVRQQATVLEGSLDDVAFVTRATQGVDALFWLTPPNLQASDLRAWYRRFGEVAAEAVQANRIPYVVHVSSGGGGVVDAGPVSGLHDVEHALDGVATNVLHLRCGNFMENFLTQLEPIQHQGCFYYPIPGDYPYPMVAAQDIASVAAEYLQTRSWTGSNVLAVHGAADLSNEEAARILSEVLGKTVRFVCVPPEQFRQVLLSQGTSSDGAEQLLRMFHAFSEKNAYAAEPRTPETTTATTLAQWARTVMLPLIQRNSVEDSISGAGLPTR